MVGAPVAGAAGRAVAVVEVVEQNLNLFAGWRDAVVGDKCCCLD